MNTSRVKQFARLAQEKQAALVVECMNQHAALNHCTGNVIVLVVYVNNARLVLVCLGIPTPQKLRQNNYIIATQDRV